MGRLCGGASERRKCAIIPIGFKGIKPVQLIRSSAHVCHPNSWNNALIIYVCLQEKYYQPLIKQGRLKEEDMELYLFASKPSGGAAVLKPGRFII